MERYYRRPCPLCPICLTAAAMNQDLSKPQPLSALPAGPTLLGHFSDASGAVWPPSGCPCCFWLCRGSLASCPCCSELPCWAAAAWRGVSQPRYSIRPPECLPHHWPAIALRQRPLVKPCSPCLYLWVAERQPACLFGAAGTGVWAKPGTLRTLVGTAVLMLAVRFWPLPAAAAGSLSGQPAATTMR